MVNTAAWKLSCQESGSSTSDLARAAALSGVPSGSAYLLHKQTAGRGRRGRHWASQRGGMYVSIVLYPSQPKSQWFALSFAASLAVRDVVARHLFEQLDSHDGHANMPKIGLKWPNDVLVNNCKISGILLEAEANFLIVGCGINIVHLAPVDDSPYPPISFGDFPGTLPQPEALANSYLLKLQCYYELFEELGFAPLREIWLSHALYIGKSINVTLDESMITGVCEDVRDDGAMLLLDETGQRHHITTGDVKLIGG